jgi:predicted NBD/HSP70 family sugar kinase
VLDELRRHGPRTQADIARTTGLSPATVSNLIRELKERHVVTVTGERSGRRGVLVALDQRAGVAAGVDFGHRHVQVVIADLGHRVLAETRRELPRDHDADSDIPLTERLVCELLEQAGVSRDALVGVGLGLPAPIDPVTGEVGSTTILPGWQGVSAALVTSQRFGLPVWVDNDANLGALAELSWGVGRGYEDLVYIKLATGVGAGIVFNGELYRGAAGTAGEIGHTTIDENGPVCRCGNRGCLETYVGADALLDLLRPTHGDGLTIRDVVARALGGDRACARVLADAGRHIGLAVANLCNLLAPELIVIGGDLVAAGDVLLEPLRDVVQRHAVRSAAETAAIVPGTLGDRAEVLGAVALVLRRSTRLALLTPLEAAK